MNICIYTYIHIYIYNIYIYIYIYIFKKKKTIMKKRDHGRNRYRNISDDKREKLMLEVTINSWK